MQKHISTRDLKTTFQHRRGGDFPGMLPIFLSRGCSSKKELDGLGHFFLQVFVFALEGGSPVS